MYKKKKIIALIPARGGSKGIPRKNIISFLGKPLVAWTIEEAGKSKYIDKVVVSTEDKEVAEISMQYGAKVPFLRPQEFAADNSNAIDYIIHAIEWIKENNNLIYDLVIVLQPTSPLRTSQDIDKAIELLFAKSAKAIVSVCEMSHHPYFTNRLPEDGCMKNFIREEAVNKNRQELPTHYRLNGAIYLAYCDYIVNKKSMYGNETFAYIMPKERSIDIDDYFDFKLAKFFMLNQINQRIDFETH